MVRAGLFMFAWTCAPSSIHWIVPILATVLFGMALVGLFLGIMVSLALPITFMARLWRVLTSQSYLVEVYLVYAASALAGNTIVRSLFGVSKYSFPTALPSLTAHILAGFYSHQSYPSSSSTCTTTSASTSPAPSSPVSPPPSFPPLSSSTSTDHASGAAPSLHVKQTTSGGRWHSGCWLRGQLQVALLLLLPRLHCQGAQKKPGLGHPPLAMKPKPS